MLIDNILIRVLEKNAICTKILKMNYLYQIYWNDILILVDKFYSLYPLFPENRMDLERHVQIAQFAAYAKML